MMAALGVGSRPCLTRVCSRSAVWMRFQVPVAQPAAEIAPHRRPGWKIVRQGAPVASCAIQVQNGVEHFAHVGRTWVSSWLGRWDQRFEDRPFPLAQIAWILSSLHRSPSSLLLFARFFFLFHSSSIGPLGPWSYRASFQANRTHSFHLASQAFAHSL